MDKAERLLELAKESFGDTITEAEIKLFDEVVRGVLADYSVDEERDLRVEVIGWLCADKQAVELVTCRGICLKGARVDGLLNLAYVNIPFPLYFEKCKMPGGIELHCAKLLELFLGGCQTGNVSAYGLTVEGHVFLRNGFKSEGEINLTGSTIGGDLDCSNGHFINPDGSTIDASRARVGGNVFLSGSFKSEGKVALIDSNIEGSLMCNGAEFINNGEEKMAINASRLRCGGDVSLKRGFRAKGEVCFSGGTVGGNIDCFEGEFCNHKGDALNAEALKVGGGIFLMSDFKGEVRLLEAKVGLSLECHEGNFVNPNGYAINADSADIGRNVFLRNAFKAHGEINLIGAKIGGDIDCEKGHFINPDGIAIHGDGIEVGGSIFLRHGFIVEGIVSLTGGKIKNNLDCEYGQFTNKVGPSILAEGLSVGGSVLLCSRHLENQRKDNILDRFKAEGGVSFKRAFIGGDFDCRGSQFINPGGYALVVNSAKINGNVYLCSNQRSDKKEGKTEILYHLFRAEGQVAFDNAIIGCSFYCNGGEFFNKLTEESGDGNDTVALSLDCCDVIDSIILSDNFHAKGQVSLLCAKISKQLNCIAGRFINPNGKAFVAECARVGGNFFLCGRDFKDGETKKTVSEDELKIEGKVLLSGAEVKGCFLWCKVASPEKVSLDLRCTTIGSLWDEKKSWPEKDKLFLNGFVYKEIYDNAPRDAKARKDWLCRQPRFMSQPYEQLAKVLREGGDESDAKKILVAKENARFKQLKWYRSLPHALYWLFVGYGYRPWRAFMFGLLVIAVGWVLFGAGFQADCMVPVKDSGSYPEFQALVYSLDVFLPVIDLHQSSFRLPEATKDFKLGISERMSIPVSGKALWYYVWFEIAAGWVLTTLFVVSLSGLIRR